MENEKLEIILKMLDFYDGVYPRETIEDAVKLKDAITPYLIDHLERLLADPELYLDEEHYAVGYALILLGYFREQKAHNVIMKIAALPEKTLDELCGDMISEDFPWIFYATCGNSVERLKELVLDRSAYEYSRGAAAKAIVYAAVDGTINRESALEFFGTLFTGSEADEDSDFWSMIASRIADLYPEELMDVIQEAYETGLVYEGFIDYIFFEETLLKGKEQRLEETRHDMKHKLGKEDIHSYMSWWACFDETPRAMPPERTQDLVKKKASKIKKKKNKMAKTSRKKNRR